MKSNNTEKKEWRIALSGNPNCGKSSLFNRLTGLNQKITNVPGTTIDRKVGSFSFEGHKATIVDTPGTYSMAPHSHDEEIALEIFKEGHANYPDVIVYVADQSNLRRNLFFFGQLSQLGVPMVLALNMVDVANNKGIKLDIERLELELGVPVVQINARTGLNIEKLRDQIFRSTHKVHYDFGLPENVDDEEISTRYARIDHLLSKVQHVVTRKELVSERLDKIILHPFWGYVIFLGILFVIFQTVFKLAEWPMEWIESGFGLLSTWIKNVMAPGFIRNLIVDGVIAGLSGVVVFVPQIAILFGFMTLLEDTGYMSRVSFIMDRLLRSLGLNGKSVVPLISGAACAIPAIMAARNIENKKDRIITILVTPLMSCSARLPVYTLLIALAVPDKYVLGVINLQGLVLLSMYLLGTVASLVSAIIFKWFVRIRSSQFFIMELPVYHPPRLQNILTTSVNKAKTFVLEAGKIIFLISIVLWFLASNGPGRKMFSHSTPINLEESYAGVFGKAIEPAIEPLGYDWKIGIALLTSFAAREVFVGTMSTIYSVNSEDDYVSIRERMRQQINPATGEPQYGAAVALSLMIFYAFAMQCMSTLVIVYRETKSLKWPLIQFVYMTGLAYVASWATFNLFS